MSTILQIEYTETYFYGISLMVAAVVNLVLAGMLWFDSNNYIYTETPRYQRARRLTGLSLMVFGLGFLLHWLFMPHFTNLLAGKALSFSYFHIGGVLFSMSHTGLIDRHYLNRRVVVRDISVLCLSLVVYWMNAFVGNTPLTYVGSALFFLHIGYLTWVFYARFLHIYRQLGRFADYKPNDSDREVLWLHYSCHLIIAFGIGGMVCTVLFHDATLPFTILLFAGVVVFSYIYKALDSFGAIACEVEGNLKESEEYLKVETKDEDETKDFAGITKNEDSIKSVVERWVAERHYVEPKLTFKDALEQMNITENTLNYYLEHHTSVRGYRQWLSFLRVEEAKRQMLLFPDYALGAIADECGYSSSSTLARAFKAQEGITPMEWLNEHHGETTRNRMG